MASMYRYDDMSIPEIVETFEEQFKKIKKPDYEGVLASLDDCFIEIPKNYLDPDVTVALLDKCMTSRNKLLKIKIEWHRVATKLDKLDDYMTAILKAKISGTAIEKEGKAIQLTEKYGRAAAAAKDHADSIKQILDNVDTAALQLSRMIKVVEQPFVRVSLDRMEGGRTKEEKLVNLKKWGDNKETVENPDVPNTE